MSYDLTISADETYSESTPLGPLADFIAELPQVESNGDAGFVLDDRPKRWMAIDLEVVDEEGDNVQEADQTVDSINCIHLHIPYPFLGDAIERDYLPTAVAIAEFVGWPLVDEQTGKLLSGRRKTRQSAKKSADTTRRKKSWTAEEIMAENAADPEYQRMRAEKDRREAELVARLTRAAQPIVDELRQVGIPLGHFNDIAANFPLPPAAVGVLLKWLLITDEYHIQSALVYCLRGAAEPFDGRPLAKAFMANRDERLHAPIAETILEMKPTGIDDFILERASVRRFGEDRGVFLRIVASRFPKDTSLPILRKAVHEVPAAAAEALAEVGEPADADLLESLPAPERAWERQEIKKAIKKIRRRAERAENKRLGR
jgi:hypothetical protein